ncbi:IS110 family transposase, partial [Escherichia coli]
LEAAGFNMILVNVSAAKNVPGRKTDVNDAQWLQRRHAFGLLRASFRPVHDISVLRSYLRQRERLTEYRAAHIQHMQKALMQMNVQLHHAVSDITGVTGLSIVRAIVSGEPDPSVLIQYRDVRCKKTPEVLQQALTGNWQPEHLFALEQSVAFFYFYQEKIRERDDQIEIH